MNQQHTHRRRTTTSIASSALVAGLLLGNSAAHAAEPTPPPTTNADTYDVVDLRHDIPTVHTYRHDDPALTQARHAAENDSRITISRSAHWTPLKSNPDQYASAPNSHTHPEATSTLPHDLVGFPYPWWNSHTTNNKPNFNSHGSFWGSLLRAVGRHDCPVRIPRHGCTVGIP